CEVVGRELFCVPAEHVARKLIEENYCCQRRQGIGDNCFDRKLPFLSPELQESLLDAMIELGIVFPPLLRPQPEPEFENVRTPVAHAAVPPTVRPSISKVGCPTPAGML